MEQIDPVEALFRRAEDAKIPMSDICAEAGVAQSTPSRWKADRNTANLGTLKKMDEALSRIIVARKEAA